ncbi:hypothetical protein L218DRAFT_964284 [Marasmius fiardii PR-910]|nr:hypothetical protein L218DRAFT_964284 [Marasmius fiardii PR-910]
MIQPTASSSSSAPGLHYSARNDFNVDATRTFIDIVSQEIVQRELELKRLKQLRLSYQATLSPFHRLPSEIMESIFGYAVEKNSFGWCQAHYSSDVEKLGWICRRWRVISRSMPQIWAKIIIKFHPDTHYPVAAFRKLEYHFLRSENSLLSIEIVLVPLPHLGAIRNASQFFDLVLQESHRWGHFKYSPPPYSSFGFEYLERALSRETPSLTSLQVDPSSNQTLSNKLPLRVLNSPIQIAHLSLVGDQLLSVAVTNALHLTHLRAGVDITDAVRLLLSCPTLERAHLVLSGVDEFESRSYMATETHQALRTLTVEPSTIDCLHHVSLFICALICPSLTSLSLVTTNFRYESYITLSSFFTNALINFLRRSGSGKTLKSFQLVEIPIQTSDVIRVLHALPSLYTFRFHSIVQGKFPPILDYTFFCALNSWPISSGNGAVYPRRTVALPNLREAEFTVGTDWEDHAFENMLQSRLDGELKSVLLRIRGQVKNLDIGWLDRINSKSDLAVRVVEEGEVEREIVGYWVKPAVGLKKYCWRDLLSL